MAKAKEVKETKNINIFTEKRAVLEVLERLANDLDSQLKDATYSYEVVGKKDEQATDWRTGELLWEDEEHTIPVYRDEYDYVPLPEEELTDEQVAKVKAIATVREMLNGLI